MKSSLPEAGIPQVLGGRAEASRTHTVVHVGPNLTSINVCNWQIVSFLKGRVNPKIIIPIPIDSLRLATGIYSDPRTDRTIM